MWPFKPKVKKTGKPDISKLKEQDKDLWGSKKLKEDDTEFNKEAGFLHDLLNTFKRIKK